MSSTAQANISPCLRLIHRAQQGVADIAVFTRECSELGSQIERHQSTMTKDTMNGKSGFLHVLIASILVLLIADCGTFAQEEHGADSPVPSPQGIDPASAHLMENEKLRVWLDPTFPRVLGYSLKTHEAVFYGATKESPHLVEVNNLVFQPLSETPFQLERTYSLTPHLSENSAVYVFHLCPPRGSLSFEIVFELHEKTLEMSLRSVEELNGFQLNTLYFPDHALVSVQDSQESASVCRTDFIRNERGIIKFDGAYKGPISGMAPDGAPQRTHWGYVYTDRAVALLTNNIAIFPVHMRATGTRSTAEQVSVWNGVYHYRVMGEKMPPLRSTVRFLGDLSGDGQIDWMDGAWWLRERLPKTKAAYDDAFIYKIQCCRLPDDRFKETLKNAPEPTVYATFEQCLEIVRRTYHLTYGRPQIVYLVGWQHLGHDDKYPDLSVVNPYLGGREKLLLLMEEARQYNATVSLHVNCDAAYKDSPGWDPEIICTRPDGSLMQWSVMHNQENFHISHFKDMRAGSLLGRVDELLESLPIRHSIHYDAMRYTNESWDRSGYIGMTAELIALQKMYDRYARDDIGITIEGFTANPALVGQIDGIWHSYTHDPFLAFLMHRRWVGGGKTLEDAALGAFITQALSPDNTEEEICDIYYLGHLLRSLLQRKEMTHVSDDGSLLSVRYGDTCTAQYARKSKKRGELLVINEGVEVARNDDRFVPISDTEILTYSRRGGKVEWQLPDAWPESNLSLFRLTATGQEDGPEHQLTDRTIRFQAMPRQPYVLVRSLRGEADKL